MFPTKQLQIVFLWLTIIGIVIPYYFLLAHITSHGLEPSAIVNEIAQSRMSSFAWADVIISALALLIFAFTANVFSKRQLAIITALTLTVGVSAGLPLMFYFLAGSSHLDRGEK